MQFVEPFCEHSIYEIWGDLVMSVSPPFQVVYLHGLVPHHPFEVAEMKKTQ